MNELGPFAFWELLVLVVAVATLFAGVGVWVAHRRLQPRVRADPAGVLGAIWGQNDVLGRMYAMAGLVYSILVAFTVITVWGQYNTAKS